MMYKVYVSIFRGLYDWSQRELLKDSPLPYYLLQLENFAKLGKAGHLDADTGFAALPVVLRMTTLAREPGFRMSGVNLSSITIGGDIPALTATTVELRYLERYQAEHNPLHRAYVQKLTGPPFSTGETSGQTSDQGGRMNWARFRQLSHVAFSPLLDVFLKRVHNTFGPDIDAFAQRGNDCGFGLFYNRTVESSRHGLPTNRMILVQYLLADCPRLRFLFHLLYQEGALELSGDAARFLIFTNWPMTRWLVEMFLSGLGVDFVVINASMTAEHRCGRKIQRPGFDGPRFTNHVQLWIPGFESTLPVLARCPA